MGIPVYFKTLISDYGDSILYKDKYDDIKEQIEKNSLKSFNLNEYKEDEDEDESNIYVDIKMS